MNNGDYADTIQMTLESWDGWFPPEKPEPSTNVPEQFETPDALERQDHWDQQQRYIDEALF